MQMAKASIAVLVFVSLPLLAHPPVSVVIDARGNVYYSDLTQVWRVSPNGAQGVAVPHVHSHQLYLDAQGNLYGEHLWYEGERTDKWGHYVWRRAPNGRIDKVIPPTEGFLRDYSFVRDASGAMYWTDGTTIKKTVGKSTTVIAKGFRDVRWLHATPAGTLYFAESGNVVQLKNGRARVIAARLASPGDRHALMGVWTDRAENVYVADHAHREVKRITPQGRVTAVARSSWPWSPCGGAFPANGRALSILESSVTNSVRIRKVALP
jgi:sugar lactone lactonase YvrE